MYDLTNQIGMYDLTNQIGEQQIMLQCKNHHESPFIYGAWMSGDKTN